MTASVRCEKLAGGELWLRNKRTSGVGHVTKLLWLEVLKSAIAGLSIFWRGRCSGDQLSYLVNHRT